MGRLDSPLALETINRTIEELKYRNTEEIPSSLLAINRTIEELKFEISAYGVHASGPLIAP